VQEDSTVVKSNFSSAVLDRRQADEIKCNAREEPGHTGQAAFARHAGIYPCFPTSFHGNSDDYETTI